MMTFDLIESRFSLALAAALACATLPAIAQNIRSDEITGAIVGSEIQEQQQDVAADAAKIIAAIEHAPAATERVRKTSNLDKVEIVFLPDAAATEGGPPPEITKKIEEHKADLIELRKELEGNALLFHAIDSRQILVQDVLGVEFHDGQTATIYAAAKPAG